MSDKPFYYLPARQAGFSLIVIGLVSLALVLVHVEKDAAGNMRWWFGLTELIYSRIFFALCLGEMAVGLLILVKPTRLGLVCGLLLIFVGSVWNIAMAAISFTDEGVRLNLVSPHMCLIMGILMILMAVFGLRELRALEREAGRQKKRYEQLDFRAMIESMIAAKEFGKLLEQEAGLIQSNQVPSDFWQKHYERLAASGVKPPRPAKPEEPDGLRLVRGFGKLTPSQYAMLELAGYNLDPNQFHFDSDYRSREYIPALERISIIKRGHAALVEMTGQNFAYDLAAWRNYLATHPEHFFDHHYAAMNTRRLLDRAIADPDRQKLVEELGKASQPSATDISLSKET